MTQLPCALKKSSGCLFALFTVFSLWINARALGQQDRSALLPHLDWLTTGLASGAAPGPSPHLATDIAGNVYVAAGSLSKYDGTGLLLWAVTNADFTPINVAVDATGNVYSAGTIGGTNFGAAKYDSQGNLLWQQTFHQPGSLANVVAAAQFDTSGNSYLTGTSATGAATKFLTAKFNANGTFLWAVNYAGPLTNDSPAALVVDRQENVYVCGSSVGFGTGKDVMTLKYDPNGNPLWEARYNGPESGDDTGSAIGVDSDDKVFVTGSSGLQNPPLGGVLYNVTLKYDPSGGEVWAQRYRDSSSYFTSASLLAPDNLGGVYVAARFVYRSAGFARVFRYDSQGTIVWDWALGGGYQLYELPTVIVLDHSGNALVALSSLSVKVSPAGNLLWSVALPGQPGYGAGNFPPVNALTSDGNNNIWVAFAGALAKFSQVTFAAPAAVILFPADGTTQKYPSEIFVEATSTEAPSNMEFWDGNHRIADVRSWPPTFTWSVPGGNHTLTARFTSQSGIQVTSAPVHITIITNQFPIVQITSPTNGAYFVAPTTITIAAHATDPDGAVAKVGFFAPNQLGEAMESPYALAFNNVPPGVYTLTARATDNEGAVGVSPSVRFTVLPANSPPVMATPPLSRTVLVGTDTIFAVQAYGAAPLAYQWQFNGVDLAGQTDAQLSLTNVQSQASGIYDVVVTNKYGRVTSSNARLTLFSTDLFFSAITIAGDGRLQLGLSAPTGSSVSIQTSTDLRDWTTAGQMTVTNQAFNVTYTLEPPTSARFYRLVTP